MTPPRAFSIASEVTAALSFAVVAVSRAILLAWAFTSSACFFQSKADTLSLAALALSLAADVTWVTFACAAFLAAFTAAFASWIDSVNVASVVDDKAGEIILTGYVGLSTILTGLTVAILALATQADAPRLVFAVAVALLLLFTHRANVARLRAGTESRFEKARLLHRMTRRA